MHLPPPLPSRRYLALLGLVSILASGCGQRDPALRDAEAGSADEELEPEEEPEPEEDNPDEGVPARSARRSPPDPRRRATLDELPGDLGSGRSDASVEVFALVHLSAASPRPSLHAALRLATRASPERLHVVFRPRLDLTDVGGLHLARIFYALPDDGARRRWLGEILGVSADPWRSAAHRGGGLLPLQARANTPDVDRLLAEALREQVRLGVTDRDVAYVNGKPMEPFPGEQALLFAARREHKRLSARPDRRYAQAEDIGPRVLPPLPTAPSATDRPPVDAEDALRLDLVLFLDARDPHSRRLGRHLSGFLRDSPLASTTRLRVAAYPLERHAGAFEAAALSFCAQGVAPAEQVLDAFVGDLYDRPDVRADGVCDALHLDEPGCERLASCASDRLTADAILAERGSAREAGVRGPPALFLEGRRIVARGLPFSRPFLEGVLLGYYQRDWTLPAESRLGASTAPDRDVSPDGRLQ